HHENGGEIAMRDLDDEVGATHGRKPVAITLRPVVAASHSGARDANDRAEDEMETRHDERRERRSTNAVHCRLVAMLSVEPCVMCACWCIARQVKISTKA